MHNVPSRPMLDLFNLFVIKFELEHDMLNHNCSYILLNRRIHSTALDVIGIRDTEDDN